MREAKFVSKLPIKLPLLGHQVERVVTIMQNPRQYKIPDWFLNRQKDVKDGKYSQVSGWVNWVIQSADGSQ